MLMSSQISILFPKSGHSQPTLIAHQALQSSQACTALILVLNGLIFPRNSSPPIFPPITAIEMTDTFPAAATSSSNPCSEEMEELAAMVAGLSQMSLVIAQHCFDLQTQLPLAFNAAVAEAIAAALPPPTVLVKGVPRTPDQLDAAHPPGSGDDIPYHVVTTGREPGLYASVAESDAQVHGVPSKPLRKATRMEALAYYCSMYEDGKVEKWTSGANLPDDGLRAVGVEQGYRSLLNV
ncbi:hypothetical protein B0H17DRAFT_1149998 [Mycena rosella]|uniref:Uncharacterized protein n=1 Tax=Mycena rosella TaxID=1033263 RepID=A0AAD7BVD5_MYCRO|nr:hypothetical protein B0H17DRAFT_1149998 [Mycena rosella]